MGIGEKFKNAVDKTVDKMDKGIDKICDDCKNEKKEHDEKKAAEKKAEEEKKAAEEKKE